MNTYDQLIQALQRESELSTCSEAQRAANLHMINLYKCLKNKKTSDIPTVTHDLATDLMMMRIADPTYTFSIRSLRDD